MNDVNSQSGLRLWSTTYSRTEGGDESGRRDSSHIYYYLKVGPVTKCSCGEVVPYIGSRGTTDTTEDPRKKFTTNGEPWSDSFCYNHCRHYLFDLFLSLSLKTTGKSDKVMQYAVLSERNGMNRNSEWSDIESYSLLGDDIV